MSAVCLLHITLVMIVEGSISTLKQMEQCLLEGGFIPPTPKSLHMKEAQWLPWILM